MAAMFRSLRDSAFVMATRADAVLGGVLGLRALDLAAGQTLDLLSMIGFIMLLGMVINNAILLVAQAREGQAAGASLDEALKQALDQRLRPILIGALTGVLGALPMAINPGPAAVIYRGLAAVSVGGVALSLLFLVVGPARCAGAGRRRVVASDRRRARTRHSDIFGNDMPLHKSLIAAALAVALIVPLLDSCRASAPAETERPALSESRGGELDWRRAAGRPE